MLTLFYAPGACSMAAHIVLEESGEKYEAKRMDLAKGEQKTAEYMKIHPLGRVPALKLDDGSPLSENTAILPFLGKRFDLWPADPVKEARALIGRPERYTEDKSAFAGLQAMGKKTFHEYLKQIDGMCAGREWLSDKYSVLDPYAFVFYVWGVRRELPMAELKSYSAFRDRMVKRPAVQRVVADEAVKVA
jgi:glutathione S-transferase